MKRCFAAFVFATAMTTAPAFGQQLNSPDAATGSANPCIDLIRLVSVLQQDRAIKSPVSFLQASKMQREGDEQACRQAVAEVQGAFKGGNADMQQRAGLQAQQPAQPNRQPANGTHNPCIDLIRLVSVLQQDASVTSPVSFSQASDYLRQDDRDACQRAATEVEAAMSTAQGETQRRAGAR